MNHNGRRRNNKNSKKVIQNSNDKSFKLSGAVDKVEKIGRTIGNKIDSEFNLRVHQQYVRSKYILQCADHICVPRYNPLLTHIMVFI